MPTTLKRIIGMTGYRRVAIASGTWTRVGALLMLHHTGHVVHVVVDEDGRLMLPPAAWQIVTVEAEKEP